MTSFIQILIGCVLAATLAGGAVLDTNITVITTDITAEVGTMINLDGMNDLTYQTMTDKTLTSDAPCIVRIATREIEGDYSYQLMPVSEGETDIVCTGTVNGEDVIERLHVTVTSDDAVLTGADLSVYQTGLSIASLKSDYNLDFVILRAGHGAEADTMFTTYAAECDFNQMPYGVYWYLASGDETSLMTTHDAESQANLLCNQLDQTEGSSRTLPVYLDLESATLCEGADDPASHIQTLCETFVSVAEARGYAITGLYVNTYFCTTYLNDAYFLTYEDLWYARYGVSGSQPTLEIQETIVVPAMWQTGNSFTIEGIDIDMDYLYI